VPGLAGRVTTLVHPNQLIIKFIGSKSNKLAQELSPRNFFIYCFGKVPSPESHNNPVSSIRWRVFFFEKMLTLHYGSHFLEKRQKTTPDPRRKNNEERKKRNPKKIYG
jgi:hypothetical protein